MSIWAVTLGASILIVLVTRGRFFALARMSVRGLWLLLLSAALQIGIGFVNFPEARIDSLGFGLLMVSYALLLAFCFANLGLRGMGVVTVGIAMNTVVIGLNQGMPSTDEVWRDGELVSEPFEETVKHQPETDEDLLPFLGDIIVIPEPFQEAISFGDLVLAVGVIDLVFWGSRKRRRKTAEELEEERLAEEEAQPLEPVVVMPVPVPATIDLVEAEREEAEREAEPARESRPARRTEATRASSEGPATISWRPPTEEHTTIDLSAHERAESGGDERDSASGEHPLQRTEDPSVVDIRRL